MLRFAGQARRGPLRRGAKTGRHDNRLLAHPHAPLTARHLSACSATLVGPRCHPKAGSLTAPRLATPAVRGTLGAAACPTHASARSQPVPAAVSAAAPSPRTHPRLRPLHSLYISCACMLFAPFHISPKASVALLTCSLASRSCSSDPPTAALAASDTAAACRVCSTVAGQPCTTPPHWLAGTRAACRAVSSPAGLGAQSVRPEGREELEEQWRGGGAAPGRFFSVRRRHPPQCRGDPAADALAVLAAQSLLLIGFLQLQGAPRPSAALVWTMQVVMVPFRACLCTLRHPQSPPCLESANAHHLSMHTGNNCWQTLRNASPPTLMLQSFM